MIMNIDFKELQIILTSHSLPAQVLLPGAQLGIFEGRGPVHIKRHIKISSSSRIQLGILFKLRRCRS